MPFQFWSGRRRGGASNANPAPQTGAYQAALAVIKERFRLRLRDDYAFLIQYKGKPLLQELDVIARVHRLAGSAGMVGYGEISTVAGRLDDAFAESNEDTAAGFEELLQLIAEAIASGDTAAKSNVN